ncbi:MAG: YtxH domain-containing protein, partial [Saprospiraceae bacterium]|nr:YtxH domain-containing protein [Saprospiraceae bacterium]
MTTGKIVLSIAAGVAAGAILGILFAPAKGVDTRKKIVQKRDEAIDNFNEM